MENLSALMDGELEDQPAQRELARIKDDAELRETWYAFHLIGDTMRGERALSAEFDALVMKRLAAEPTVLSPMRRRTSPKRVMAYALSAAASVSAIGFVAWVALGPTAPGVIAQPAQPASGAIVQPVATIAPGPSEGSMNEYILAHQGFSPSGALMGLAPYIRSVSFRPAEGR